jgi:antitoxin component YwqK of YwqJK toxin-antitoxin module
MPRHPLNLQILRRLVPLALVAAAAACSGPKQCPEGLEKDKAKSKQLEIWCRSPDGKKASWTELMPDGKGRRQTCNYSAGAAEGSYFAWYPNGKVWIEGVYRGGEKAGKWAQFTEAGDLTAKGEYRFGRFVAGAPVGRMALCEDMKP